MSLLQWARLALGIGILATIAFAVQLPFPPATPHERTTAAIFGTLLVLQAIAVVALPTRRGSARALVYLLGAVGGGALILHAPQLTKSPSEGPPLSALVMLLLNGLALAIAAGCTLAEQRRRP
jgi:hypothetical protein